MTYIKNPFEAMQLFINKELLGNQADVSKQLAQIQQNQLGIINQSQVALTAIIGTRCFMLLLLVQHICVSRAAVYVHKFQKPCSP